MAGDKTTFNFSKLPDIVGTGEKYGVQVGTKEHGKRKVFIKKTGGTSCCSLRQRSRDVLGPSDRHVHHPATCSDDFPRGRGVGGGRLGRIAVAEREHVQGEVEEHGGRKQARGTSYSGS